MEQTKADVLILGAGIVGLTLAHELQKSGRHVTVIDKGEPGFGSSYGNAGWVTPCFAMPLPQPGMFLKSIGWLLNPDSPLHIKPEPSWMLARWMMSFLAAMNEKQMRESIAALTEISKYSLKFYQEMAQRQPNAFGYNQKGLLMVSATEAGLRSARNEMDLMAEHGIPGRSLSAEEVIAMEPSVKPIIRGGVYFPTEASVEPLATVKTLAKEFEAAGGKIQKGTEVFDFKMENGKITEVITTRGTFKADLVVLASGSWSRAMARQLQVTVPILGGKGYSMIVDDFSVTPQYPMMIVERKIAVTPREGSVRLAGTLELVDGDESITPRRVRNILTGSQEYLHLNSNPQIYETWRGLRPCTPDGVPMLGFSKKWSNLFYSVGHQMLGLQSAPGSARLSADLILGRPTLTDPRPFRPERFE